MKEIVPIAFLVFNIVLATIPIVWDLFDKIPIGKGNRKSGTPEKYKRKMTIAGKWFIVIVAVTILLGIWAYFIQTEKESELNTNIAGIKIELHTTSSKLESITNSLKTNGITVTDNGEITFGPAFYQNIKTSPAFNFNGSFPDLEVKGNVVTTTISPIQQEKQNAKTSNK